jgi:hypothetical protein
LNQPLLLLLVVVVVVFIDLLQSEPLTLMDSFQ